MKPQVTGDRSIHLNPKDAEKDLERIDRITAEDFDTGYTERPRWEMEDRR